MLNSKNKSGLLGEPQLEKGAWEEPAAGAASPLCGAPTAGDPFELQVLGYEHSKVLVVQAAVGVAGALIEAGGAVGIALELVVSVFIGGVFWEQLQSLLLSSGGSPRSVVSPAPITYISSLP